LVRNSETQTATAPKIVGITGVYGENTFILIVWLKAERYSLEIQLHKSKEFRNKHFKKPKVGRALSVKVKVKVKSQTVNNASVHKPITASPLRACKMHIGRAITEDTVMKSVTSNTSKCVKVSVSTTSS